MPERANPPQIDEEEEGKKLNFKATYKLIQNTYMYICIHVTSQILIFALKITLFIFFSPEPEVEVDEKLVDLLRQLDLEKYVEVFQQQEIDFDSFLTFSDEDLKRIGIK